MFTSLSSVPRDRPLTIQYLRLSTEEQTNGHGLERQRNGCDEWCRRNGVVPDLRLEDVGYSAFSGDHIRRGQMGSLLRAVEEGRIARGTTLVLENLDRLTRQDLFEALEVFSGIVRRDLLIVTACDGQRYGRDGTSAQRMMTIMTTVLHLGRGNSESEIKSIRVGEAWAKKHQRARDAKVPHGRRCPAWIRLGPDGYELIEKRAETVRWMFERAAAGWGRRQIVKDLVDRGVQPWAEPTAKRPTPRWNDSYVQKILTGTEAIGEYHPSEARAGSRRLPCDPVPEYYPAAVDRGTFERGRSAAALRRGIGGRKGALHNLLQGLCRCGVCGKGMTLENKGARTSGLKLVCQRALLNDCGHKARYHYTLVERGVIFGISAHADDLLRAARSRGEESAMRLAARQGELRDVEDRIRRVVKRMEVNDDEALDAALRELRASAREIASGISDLTHEVVTAHDTAGEGSPHSFVAFYERLKAVPGHDRLSARAEVNQRLRALLSGIVFEGTGRIDVQFRGGSRTLIQVPQNWAPRRSNPGQYASSKDASGRQARRGRAREG